jgi:hypothetical protein
VNPDRRVVSDDGGLPAGAVAAGLLMLAWTSVMLPGFVFPYGNNIFHVPIVLDYAGSAEGPHDAFTRSLDGFVSGVWPTLSLLATETNIFWVFFGAHLAARLVFVAGCYGLIKNFGASRIVALALAGLAALGPIFKVESVVGRNDALTFYFTHTELAMAMLPGCWWLLIRRRWIAGGAAIGLMFNINAFLAIWSAVAAFAAFLSVRSGEERPWRRLLLCVLACGLTALPTAIWTLKTVMQAAPKIPYRDFLLDYYPYHNFIHVQWDRAARYLAYLIAAYFAARTALRQLGGDDAKILAVLLASFAAIFLAGIPLPYLTDSRLLLNLYPLRLDSVVNLAAAASALAWAGRSLSRPPGERDALPLAIALALLVGNMVATLLLLNLRLARRGPSGGRLVLGLVTLAAIGLLAIGGSLPELSKGFIPIILIFCALALCAAFDPAEAETERPWVGAVTLAFICSVLPERVPPFWPLLALALAVAGVLSGIGLAAAFSFALAGFTCLLLLPAGDPVALIAASLLFAAGLLLAYSGPATARLVALGRAPMMLLAGMGAIGLVLGGYAAMRGTVERPDMNPAAEYDAQRWARANIEPHVPLMAVGVEGFGVLSRRPIWLDRKAGAAVMWEPSYLAEWQGRADQLAACSDSSCFASLARRHRVPWLVTTPGRLAQPEAAGLGLRFRNELYEIYKVENVTAAAPTEG